MTVRVPGDLDSGGVVHSAFTSQADQHSSASGTRQAITAVMLGKGNQTLDVRFPDPDSGT
jgi:hypothetical protein